jgi:hypothetical protein
MLGPNNAAQALLQALRDIDVHASRFIEELDVNEQIDGSLFGLSGAHVDFGLGPCANLMRMASVGNGMHLKVAFLRLCHDKNIFLDFDTHDSARRDEHRCAVQVRCMGGDWKLD